MKRNEISAILRKRLAANPKYRVPESYNTVWSTELDKLLKRDTKKAIRKSVKK